MMASAERGRNEVPFYKKLRDRLDEILLDYDS